MCIELSEWTIVSFTRCFLTSGMSRRCGFIYHPLASNHSPLPPDHAPWSQPWAPKLLPPVYHWLGGPSCWDPNGIFLFPSVTSQLFSPSRVLEASESVGGLSVEVNLRSPSSDRTPTLKLISVWPLLPLQNNLQQRVFVLFVSRYACKDAKDATSTTVTWHTFFAACKWGFHMYI